MVTAEIAGRHTIQDLGRPTAVIPNGIDLSKYPSLAAPRNDAPRLAFLGAPRSPWHGVDKIEQLARLFPTWTFDVIGPSRAEFADLPPNVNVHGLMDPVDFLPILAQADVAIGPLAMHRIPLSEASPLKVGEYLAYGLPVIIGYADTRFPDGAPFLLEIPNSEDNVEASRKDIDKFVRSWMGRRVERSAIRSIDSRIIERKRLDFLLELLPEQLRDLAERPAVAKAS